MFRKIELDAPCLGEIEKKYLCDVIDSGFISSVGPCISEFEKKVARYLGVKGAVALQSGTAAIYMALHELGIGSGDEVIVPSLTFTATVNPILYVGATPVIIDVDLKTWNIDPIKIREVITNKTKAIIPVHLYGNPCDMKEILAIAKEYSLFVIEDATESLGSKLNDQYTGVFGDLGCFSFNGNKLITTGGGGMIISNHVDKLEHIRVLINQAKDKDKPGLHSELGFNFRMTNIEAALGLAQFEKIDEFLEKKKIFKKIYHKILGDLAGVNFQKQYNQAISCEWLTCITIEDSIKISDFMEFLQKKNIPSRRIFLPVNGMPYLKKYAMDCSNAEAIYNKGLCLPSSMLNTVEDVEYVCQSIKEALVQGL